MLTTSQLKAIMPLARRREVFLPCLVSAMDRYFIDTPLRQASFLAQIAHESGELRYVRELASGRAYERRRDLGNVVVGDGVKYKGRGLIQITGRANYKACGEALGMDLLNHPELLESPEAASLSAAWFWLSHGCNELADYNDQRGLCRRINGGFNGLSSRIKYFERALKVLHELPSERKIIPLKQIEPETPMFGIDDAVTAVTTLADTAIKRIWPDATEIEKAKLRNLTETIQNELQVQLKQLEVNNTEAANANTWVSGARPFVMWTCGAALAYASLIEPIARFLALVIFGYTGVFPVIDTSITMQVLFGILGLGAYRSVEKVKGVARI